MWVEDGRGHAYPLPLHHGKKAEPSDVYVRALYRAFDIPYDDLQRRLH